MEKQLRSSCKSESLFLKNTAQQAQPLLVKKYTPRFLCVLLFYARTIGKKSASYTKSTSIPPFYISGRHGAQWFASKTVAAALGCVILFHSGSRTSIEMMSLDGSAGVQRVEQYRHRDLPPVWDGVDPARRWRVYTGSFYYGKQIQKCHQDVKQSKHSGRSQAEHNFSQRVSLTES
eukprot:5111116-Amphidinium_carterae.3